MLPNFLIIGAMKSGTTAISNFLSQHPDIYMHPLKELHFFSTFENDSYCLENGKIKAFSLDEYNKLFSKVNSEKIIGEASTSYLYVKKSAYQIKNYIPSSKILVILRNPIHRAFSHYNFMVSIDLEQLSFEESIKQESIRINKNLSFGHYLQRGKYYKQLKTYFNLFDRRKVKVLIYEDFVKDPKSFMYKIFDFLELHNRVEIDFSNRYQISGKPKIKLLNDILVKPNFLKQKLRPILPKKVENFLLTIRDKNLIKSKMNLKTQNKLIEFYKENILKTSNLIDIDLKEWLCL